MLEQTFTSTYAKLLQHPERFSEWKRGIYRPVSLQLAPTDRCNLKCSFCSVANRKGDELSLDNIQVATSHLVSLGLKAVEITGGGDPTLYVSINALLRFLSEQKLHLGLITNGVALEERITPDNLGRLQWLRISLNSLDYVRTLKIPNIQGTLGFSYVLNEKTTPDTADRIKQLMQQHSPAYLRLVPNCLSTETISQSKTIALRTGLMDLPNTFYQTKSYYVPAACHIGYLKPFLAPDGYFYHCSANPLIEQRFNEQHRMGSWKEVERIWQAPFPSAPVRFCQNGKCFFQEHNDLLMLLRTDVPHPDFI